MCTTMVLNNSAGGCAPAITLFTQGPSLVHFTPATDRSLTHVSLLSLPAGRLCWWLLQPDQCMML